MSQYVSTEEEELVQVASNLGWSEFCEWVDGTEVDDYPGLHHLRKFGYDNDPDELLADLEHAIEQADPPGDVESVAYGLVDFLHEHQDAEIILVGGGMTSDEPDEDDEEDEESDDDES